MPFLALLVALLPSAAPDCWREPDQRIAVCLDSTRTRIVTVMEQADTPACVYGRYDTVNGARMELVWRRKRKEVDALGFDSPFRFRHDTATFDGKRLQRLVDFAPPCPPRDSLRLPPPDPTERSFWRAELARSFGGLVGLLAGSAGKGSPRSMVLGGALGAGVGAVAAWGADRHWGGAAGSLVGSVAGPMAALAIYDRAMRGCDPEASGGFGCMGNAQLGFLLAAPVFLFLEPLGAKVGLALEPGPVPGGSQLSLAF